jgi:hypothetical protein
MPPFTFYVCAAIPVICSKLLLIFAIESANTMNSLNIYAKFDALPESLKKEVSDFIDFLTTKKSDKKAQVAPKFGSAKGKIKMATDFDASPEDFNDYM